MVFLGILVNGMTLMNISEYCQYVVCGLLILSAVLINRANQSASTIADWCWPLHW